MFFPYIKDIATQELSTIDITDTVGSAIHTMIESDHRALVVKDGHFNHLILAQDLLTTNHQTLDLNQPVKEAVIHRLPKIHKDKNILEAIHFLQESVEYIAAVDDDEQIFGILSHGDLINATDPEILMENYSIGEVIKSQKNDIWVKPDELAIDVIRRMKEYNKDCATVIKDGEPIGIFTIKDVLSIYKKHDDLNVCICDVMTSPVEHINAKASIKEAIEFIKSKPFKRLVVVNDDHQLVGMSLQKELIALAYSNWASIMKQHHQELLELNNLLSEQADRYKHLAATDPLTNLYNRYKFIELYTTEAHAMTQRQQPLSLLMLDVDYFKQINDNHGHNVGDDVLTDMAKLIKSTVRNIDIVSRWGGEEFVVLLPTVDIDQAKIISEKLRVNIAKHLFSDNLNVTISIGIHQIDEHDSIEETISKADHALYQAKQNGRNRAVIFDSF